MTILSPLFVFHLRCPPFCSSFATALQATLREVGAWLVWLAHIVYHFNERELYRANNEVKDVADGRYDWRIDRIDCGRGGGISR